MRKIHPARYAVLLVAAAMAAVADEATAQTVSRAKAAAIDLSYLPSECFGVVVIHPRQILDQSVVKKVPAELMRGLKENPIEVDPRSIEEVVLGLAPQPEGSQGRAPFLPVAIVRFAEPVDVRQIAAKMWEEPEEAKKGSTTYYRVGRQPSVGAVYAPNDRTIVATEESLLDAVLKPKAGKSRLAAQLARLDPAYEVLGAIEVEPVRGLLAAVLQEAPPPVQSALQAIHDHAQSAMAAIDLGGDTMLKLAVEGKDAESAAALEKTVQQYFDLAKGLYAVQGRPQLEKMPPEMGDLGKILGKIADELLAGITIRRVQTRVVVLVKTPQALGDLPEAMGPAVVAARGAAERAARFNNLKQIGLACHNYHDVYRKLPQDIVGKDGKPLLSWRVQLLPFLEQQALYDRFRLDEPWDSPNNKRLLGESSSVFRIHPDDKSGKTRLLAFSGEGAGLTGQTLSFADIRDGLSNTILAVEAGEDKAVPWTKPEDIPFDPENPKTGLGTLPPGGFVALLFDGSVRTLSSAIDAETLKALITRSGGESIPSEKLK